MPKSLTPAQIEQYWEEGCVFPIRVMPETEAAELRRRLEAFEQRTDGPLKGDLRPRLHIPAPAGVRALGVCPAEARGEPALVAVVGSEVWVIRAAVQERR